VLDSFGGGRVIIGVTSTPFKCPPAPSETALVLHDYLVERGGWCAAWTRNAGWRSSLKPESSPSGRPAVVDDEPSDLLLAGKAEFGASRVRRWFDRNWTSY
jgi:hypothetical protein